MPDYIDEIPDELWDAWLEYRKKSKWPVMPPYAEVRERARLNRLCKTHDVSMAIVDAMVMGYRGVLRPGWESNKRYLRTDMEKPSAKKEWRIGTMVFDTEEAFNAENERRHVIDMQRHRKG